MNDARTVLFVTVGGSHQPIVAAIRNVPAERVVFFCTDRDPATGRQGSISQITGRGPVIRQDPSDPVPTLPNIPAQTGLAAERYQAVIVPADELDPAVAAMHGVLSDWRRREPGARLVADYTGGTKTMSGALVLAALEVRDVELQVVTGARADLVRVRSGTEAVCGVELERLRFERAFDAALAPWGRHAYDEAALVLERLGAPRAPGLRARWQRARDLSQAFAAWDRFDQPGAWRLLEPYAPVVSAALGAHIGALKALNAPEPARSEPARLLDLARNAERRAVQGRYDDALARLYRLVEWSAQWLLRDIGIDTADVPPDRIPSDVSIAGGRDGRRQAGLFAAWQLLAHHRPESAAGRFFALQSGPLLQHLRIRNGSILAHGFQPVDHARWSELWRWTEGAFLPALRAELDTRRIRLEIPQLPTDAPELSDRTRG